MKISMFSTHEMKYIWYSPQKSKFSFSFILFLEDLQLIIPTQCFYRFFGDFDWSIRKIKLFLHFDKSPCVGIFDNCLDITVVDCVGNNEMYIKL